MKLIIIIISILNWYVMKVANEACSKPETYISWLHIFRTADVDITVYHCHSASHSDITMNCINAFNTGVFVNKWYDKHYINATDSTIKFKTYTAKANKMRNEIRLRSGTVCRYDRGFCYDPKESVDFAVVWETTDEKSDINAKDLIEIFYGPASIWQFRNNSSYLVLQESGKEHFFALRLEKSSTLNGEIFWYSNEYGMIVSEGNFKNNVTRFWDKKSFPLKPQQFVSEQVLGNCDLQNFPFDFEKNTYQNHIFVENNLVAILDKFQKQLLETKENLTVINKENSINSQFLAENQKDLRDVKTSLLAKDQEIAEIRGTIKNVLNALSKHDLDELKLQEEIDKLLAQQQGAELDKINEKLAVLQHQLSKLSDDSDSDARKINKGLAKLENNLTLLEITLLEKNAEIFKALYSKDKLMNDMQNNLFGLYGELQNKYIELQSGQKNTSIRLNNIELDLNRQNHDLTKFQNYSKQKDEKISQIQDVLVKQDAEIKKLYEYFNKIDEESKNTDKKLKEKDDEIRRIQNNLIIKYEEFRAEVNKRDQEYKQLEAQIKKIKEIFNTVEAL